MAEPSLTLECFVLNKDTGRYVSHSDQTNPVPKTNIHNIELLSHIDYCFALWHAF